MITIFYVDLKKRKAFLVSWPGSRDPGLMYLCTYIYFSVCSVLVVFFSFFLRLSLCVYVGSHSWMFWIAEGLRPGSVPALEAATPAAGQPSTAAADGLVKSALFKNSLVQP